MDRDKHLQGVGEVFLSPSLAVSAQLCSDRVGVSGESGEMALSWAVFTDGLEQYWQLARNPSVWHSASFQAEEEWVLADDRDYPLSFINLCEVFGLKVEEVRSLLLAWKHAHRSLGRPVIPQT